MRKEDTKRRWSGPSSRDGKCQFIDLFMVRDDRRVPLTGCAMKVCIALRKEVSDQDAVASCSLKVLKVLNVSIAVAKSLCSFSNSGHSVEIFEEVFFFPSFFLLVCAICTSIIAVLRST